MAKVLEGTISLQVSSGIFISQLYSWHARAARGERRADPGAVYPKVIPK